MYGITDSTYGRIELEKYDTSNHKGILLPGSTALLSNSEYGKILIQEYAADKFTIHYNEFSLSVKNRLSIVTESHVLQTTSALQTKINQNFSGHKVTIKEGQFLLVPAPSEYSELTLEAGKENRQFLVGYQTSLVEELIPYFPFLERLIKGEQVNSIFSAISVRWMPGEVSDIINQILHCSYEPVLRDFFFDDKAGDLLFYMLVELSKKKPVFKDMSPSDIDKVHACRAIILSDLSQHFNISKLARKVGINEFKLKTGFKQLFGVGPFAFLRKERMNKAYDLLLNTDKPIKDIQYIAGYASLTSFVGAFRKFFGRTPGDIRYR